MNITPSKFPLINSLLQQSVEYTPIWLMRQAGRYLPEYRKLREKAGSFLNLCKNPDLATVVTLQPLKRFNLDAAILFSDILVIPDALDMGLHFIENEGPKFSKTIATSKEITSINMQDALLKLDHVFATIAQTQQELNGKAPLIGFSGSPFTLLCYMLEGGSSTNYLTTKKWLYTRPLEAHAILAYLADMIILYLNRQIESGADAVMIFDSWGGVLTNIAYQEFSLTYLKKIVSNLKKTHNDKAIPNIVFTKGGGVFFAQITDINASAIGLDWSMDIAHAKKILNTKFATLPIDKVNSTGTTYTTPALQGNLDPVILAVGDKAAIKKEAEYILTSYLQNNNFNHTGHVFNLGHGALPITSPDNVAHLIDIVHEFKIK